MIRRLRNDFQLGFKMLAGGATFASVFLYPLRRRRSREIRLQLRNGISISSPATENLARQFREIWVEGCYLPGKIPLDPGTTVVDIGANAGVFSLWSAEHGAGRVIAVEPSPSMCQYLSRNVKANTFTNVTVVRAACGGRSGEAALYSRGNEALNSLYSQDVFGSEFRLLCMTPLLTLADLFERYDVAQCDLLKLDCEGAEYEILLAAGEDTLRRVQRIAMEYHVGLNEHQPRELADFLEDHGFRAEKTPLCDPEGGYLYAIRKPAV